MKQYQTRKNSEQIRGISRYGSLDGLIERLQEIREDQISRGIFNLQYVADDYSFYIEGDRLETKEE